MQKMLFAVLAGTVLLAGCQTPPPPEVPPLVYEDPTVPPDPVATTDRIRDGAVVETKGSRGGAALRQPEHLAVLSNAHEGADAVAVKPTAYEQELIDEAKRVEAERLAAEKKTKAEARAKRKAALAAKRAQQNAKDKSFYAKKAAENASQQK